jgi:hypothetical protein
MTENPRTTAARDNDDHELIDAAVEEADTGITGSSAGGGLQTNIGSQADFTQAVEEPEASTRVHKSDEIAADQARPSNRGPDRENG